MLKDNIYNNMFKIENIQERKQAFTQKMAELINQMENSSPVGIYKQGDHMYNERQADRLVFYRISNEKERR